MQAVDQEVLTQVCHWLKEGQSCWLATVVATYGSSPRPVGSLFTCSKKARVVGSLSGGCVEEDLVEKLVTGELASDKPFFMRYGKTEAEATKFGLPCGGQLDIVVEPLNALDSIHVIYSQINSVLNQRGSVRRTVELDTGDSKIVETSKYSPLVYDAENHLLVQTYGPRRQLFIIGTNMVAQYVAEFAQTLDFRVTVVDTDQTKIDSFPVPGVEKVCDLPDDIVLKQANDQNSAIVALSHDPRLDDMALIGAFETRAFYIGAMGSQKTSSARRDRLRALGVSERELTRLHAPIGFDIGSKTPPEIAVSIMAEITQTQYNKN
ncbi:MAG: XdhC family protein [Gammaproteobacteria bacterium]|nr:XdhC family protein [Gammaproteobacteria bacterium]MXW07813.1 XdhC family protein [Gammaproteobacteria bacterium]MYC26157.1 XdhC family protein [Gammaproteobacteria bacterium]